MSRLFFCNRLFAVGIVRVTLRWFSCRPPEALYTKFEQVTDNMEKYTCSCQLSAASNRSVAVFRANLHCMKITKIKRTAPSPAAYTKNSLTENSG